MRGRGPAILAIALGVANGIYIFKPMLEEQAAQKQALLGVDEKDKKPTSTEASTPAPTSQASTTTADKPE